MGKKISLRERVARQNRTDKSIQEKVKKSLPKVAKQGPIIIPAKKQTIIVPKSKKRAIISDIHGNYSALTAVIVDCIGKDVDEIWCLGDSIGYYGETERIAKIIQKGRVKAKKRGQEYFIPFKSCMGNHEELAQLASMGMQAGGLRGIGVSKDAAESIVIAAQHLKSANSAKVIGEMHNSLEKFLYELPDTVNISAQSLGMHGFKQEILDFNGDVKSVEMKYVLPEKLIKDYGITNREVCADPETVIRQSGLLQNGKKRIYTGHTHLDWAFIIDRNGKIVRSFVPKIGQSTRQIPKIYLTPEELAVISTGAVGVVRSQDYKVLAAAEQRGYFLQPAHYVIEEEISPNKVSVEFAEIYYDYRNSEKIALDEGMPQPNPYKKGLKIGEDEK